MARFEYETIEPNATTTFGVRCDGSQIEEFVQHSGTFLARPITWLQAMTKSREYASFALQMAEKAQQDKVGS